MLVHAKKPHIELEIRGEGTKIIEELIKKNIPDVEITNENEDEYVLYNKTDFYNEMVAETTPGKTIWTYRDNSRLTLKQLSEKTDIAESHLSDMENDKRGIGKITAKKLGKALNCDYRRFL